jgi:hypothetical protein
VLRGPVLGNADWGFRYNPVLEGVMLSFQNVRVPEGVGRIVDEQPYVNVHAAFEVP